MCAKCQIFEETREPGALPGTMSHSAMLYRLRGLQTELTSKQENALPLEEVYASLPLSRTTEGRYDVSTHLLVVA